MEILTEPLYGDINAGCSAIVLACFYLFIFFSLPLRSYHTYSDPSDEESKRGKSKSPRDENSFQVDESD